MSKALALGLNSIFFSKTGVDKEVQLKMPLRPFSKITEQFFFKLQKCFEAFIYFYQFRVDDVLFRKAHLFYFRVHDVSCAFPSVLQKSVCSA